MQTVFHFDCDANEVNDNEVPVDNSAHDKNDRELTTWLLAIAVLGINFVNPTVSILLGGILATWVIFVARPEGFIPLLLLITNRADFSSEYGTVEQQDMAMDTGSISVAGIPIALPYIILAAIALRVGVEFFRHPETFQPVSVRRLMYTILPMLGLAVWESVISLSIGDPSWTLSIRTQLLLIVFFYGFILAKNWPEDCDFLLRGFVGLAAPVMLLAITGHYFNRMLDLIVAIATPLSILGIWRGSMLMRLYSVASLVLVAIYSLGYGTTSSGYGGSFFGESSNFTLNLLFISGVAGGTIIQLAPNLARRWIYGVALAGVILGLTVPIMIGLGWNPFSLITTGSSASATFVRLEDKILGERGVIWAASIDRIKENPAILTTSGAPLVLQGERSEVLFSAGSHNAYLEAYRCFGLVLGTWITSILVLSAGAGAFAVCRSSSRSIVALGAGIVIDLAITAPLVHFLDSDSFAIWHFGFAGAIFALTQSNRNLSN